MQLNPMQRLGMARARPGGGGVVYDDVGPTGLEPLVDSSIEVGRRRAPGLDQRGVEIVVKTGAATGHPLVAWPPASPRGPPRRLRRSLARFLRKRPHVADRIVLEVGDFGRHEAVDPSFGPHDVGEETGPVAVAG